MFKNGKKIPKSWLLGIIVVLATSSYHSWRWFAFAPHPKPGYFAARYPASPSFQAELDLLRRTERLDAEREALVLHATEQTSKVLQIPPSILWCLMFQESRLNNLLGIEGNIPSIGIGQFTHFGFHEINYQLNRYSPAHRLALVRLLGSDVRPITPNSAQLNTGSSYFSIPTAVVSTGLYLKNRYLHLGRLLDKRGIRYDPQILWLYAVMAYNKGTRGILSFWNAEEAKHGTNRIRKLLTSKKELETLHDDTGAFIAGFSRVWNKRRAGAFSRELSIHLKNISECALSTPVAGRTP